MPPAAPPMITSRHRTAVIFESSPASLPLSPMLACCSGTPASCSRCTSARVSMPEGWGWIPFGGHGRSLAREHTRSPPCARR